MTNGRKSAPIRLRLRAIVWLFIVQSVECRAQEPLIPFEQGDRWGYKDDSGRVVIPAQFLVAEKFSRQGLAAVADERSWAYIDTKGSIVIRPFVLDNTPDEFSEGVARVTADQKFGFFNERGQIVIKPQFDFASSFHDSLAAVCMECREERMGEHRVISGGKWGYIDKQANMAIPLQFEAAGDFENGKAAVLLDGKRRLIDTKGQVTGDEP
jgi:WG containing repeat